MLFKGALEPCKRALIFSESGLDNSEVVRWDVAVFRLVFQFAERL